MDNIEEVGNVQQEIGEMAKENEKPQIFNWDSNSTKLLIVEYKNRLEQFRDPKIKKRQLWLEIAGIFKAKHYYVTESVLDAKFRNLKHHYKFIKDNKGKSGRGRISWDFFEQMDDLLQNDRSVNPGPILATMAKPPLNEVQKEQNFQLTPTSCLQKRNILDEPDTSSKKVKNTDSRGLYHLRKEHLLLEQERVQALKNIADELKHNNRIQEERNLLLKNYLEKLK